MKRVPTGGALLRYAAAWLGAATVIVVGAIILLGPPSAGRQQRGEQELPPVAQIRLERAARVAHCDLHRGERTARVNPPAEGRGGGDVPHPGLYRTPLSVDALIAAVRRGIVVIHYRPRLPEDALEQLAALQAALPNGTIVVPNATAMPYAVAVTAWRRVLGCPALSDPAIDALRLFRGRFVGIGPGR